MNYTALKKPLYTLTLVLLACFVLIVFVRPTKRHFGINQFNRAMFLDMVQGEAHRPYVFRTLLPSTVRAATAIAPEGLRKACTTLVENNILLKKAFLGFRWEIHAAFQYLTAALLMLLSFIGFGHYTVRLTEQTLDLKNTGWYRLLLVTGAMAGLVPFFRYASYVYDPPQLFLFTLTLYLLAARRLRAFFIAFVFCALNKETAVLFIPLFFLSMRKADYTPKQFWSMLLGLVALFFVIKLSLSGIYHNTPGKFVEFHLKHNLKWLTYGWDFTEFFVFAALVTLVTFHWRAKPILLRYALFCVLPPLIGLTFFLGFIDEWRDYNEIYPITFAMIVHTMLLMHNIFAKKQMPTP